MKPLDSVSIDLTGTRLIEASAGTGKTHTITILYLRLVVELGLDVAEILVVTYTNAATAELRTANPERDSAAALHAMDARRARRDAGEGRRPIGHRSTPRSQSSSAAMPTAVSRTTRACPVRFRRGRHIHDPRLLPARSAGQRVRERHPLRDRVHRRPETPPPRGSRGLLGAGAVRGARGLRSDISDRRASRPRKCWRSWPRAPRRIPTWPCCPQGAGSNSPTISSRRWNDCSPCAVAAIWDMGRRTTSDRRPAPATTTGSIEGATSPNTIVAKVGTDHWTKSLVIPRPGISLRFKNFEKSRDERDRIEDQQGQDAANPRVLRSMPGAARAGIARTLTAAGSPRPRPAASRLVVYARTEMLRRKQERHTQSFDDLLHRHGDRDSGAVAAKRLRRAYEINSAPHLIDEFQDTDPVQYEIFRRIWHDDQRALFLIGDPKQAIYAVSGARTSMPTCRQNGTRRSKATHS